jgi:kynureninase
MIEEAKIVRMEEKCAMGTEMMIELYEAWLKPLGFTLNTPRDAKHRGGHVSLVHPDAKQIAVAMRRLINVIPDYRVPNSIRLAISPLTTSYAEAWDGMERLRDLVSSGRYKEIAMDNSRVS